MVSARKLRNSNLKTDTVDLGLLQDADLREPGDRLKITGLRFSMNCAWDLAVCPWLPEAALDSRVSWPRHARRPIKGGDQWKKHLLLIQVDLLCSAWTFRLGSWAFIRRPIRSCQNVRVGYSELQEVGRCA